MVKHVLNVLLLSLLVCPCLANATADVSDCADAVWVRVSAADSRPAAKAVSDFVCSGTNDEVTIQKAIDLCKASGRQMFLFAGLYKLCVVQDFGDGGPKAAVCLRNMHREFAFIGE